MEASKQNGNGTSIQRVIHENAPTLAPQTDIDVLAMLEKRNAMIGKILTYAISSTHGAQWADQNGKPYPTAAAAEVMARRCAVRIENVHSRKEQSSDDRGNFYYFVVEGTASLPGSYDSIEAMGTCSSRDQFLGTDTKAGRAVSAIDEGNILKAAYSNFLVNAICRLLGVRSLTWAQLEAVGVKRGEASKVEYSHGSKGGNAPAQAAAGGEFVVPFGKSKGQPISACDDSTVSWLLKVSNEGIADPAKEKYKASNERMRDACAAELKRRSSPRPAPETDPNTGEEIPPPTDGDCH